MMRTRSGQRQRNTTLGDDRGAHRGRGRIAVVLMALALATTATGTLAASAIAVPTDTSAVPISGNPLTVYVGPRGQCQSSYTVEGTVEGNFYPGGNDPFLAPFSPVGDCGFFLAFPTGTGQPSNLVNKTFGFTGTAGPAMSNLYTPVTQSAVGGDGSAANPLTQTTVFKVVDSGSKEDAQITETTTYVNGSPQFSSKYDVRNTSGSTLYFRAMYAGDLYVNNDDHGTGVLLAGPPRFVGGQNTASGVLGGLQEEPLPALPWSSLEELDFPDVWSRVTGTVEDEKAFEDKFELENVDNAVGVEWDQFRSAGLASGKEASFSIVNRTQVPSGLGISPGTQTHTVGQAATVTVTALDTAGAPYASRPVVYKIDGANPKTGSVTTNASGQATISYVGTAAGADTIQMFLDLAGNGVRSAADPAGAATALWLPAPPTPNSSYRVQSAKANSDGTITITFVPTQDGTAAIEVTVPTATIARNASIAKRRCKRNQVRIKGKCRARTSVSGRATAKGTANVPLKITVRPSRKVKKALAKGKRVQLTAKLTYKSALGGSPTVKLYHFTVKAKKKKKRKH